MSETKFCRDCRHYARVRAQIGRGFITREVCSREPARRFDLVTGESDHPAAFNERNGGSCGPSAVHFEQRPPRPAPPPVPETQYVSSGCALLFLAPFLGVLAALLCGGVR